MKRSILLLFLSVVLTILVCAVPSYAASTKSFGGTHNFAATAAPTATNDVDEGYTVGSVWIDTTNDVFYICVDNTDGAAVWNTAMAAGVSETYGSGWASDTDPPEKDDVYDYLHQIDSDDDGSIADETMTLTATTLSKLKLSALSSEPTEVVGEIYLADCDNWDPAGIGGTTDYYVICTAENTYVALWDVAGKLLVNTIQAAMNVIADNDGRVLTAAEMNSIVITSGAADYDIPADQCDTATGKWLILKVTAAVMPSLTSNDASDQFVTSDGTALTAGDELDGPGTAGSQVTVVCMAANKWYVSGEIGTWVDGGVAD